MQKITINNIKIFGHHGVYEYENEGQYFYVTIVYAYDYGDNHADRLNEVVDYTSVIDYLHASFDEIRFNLMEKLIDYLVGEFKNQFRFDYLKISITKKINIRDSKTDILIEKEISND